MSNLPPDLRETFILGERTWELYVSPDARAALEPRRMIYLGCSWAYPPYNIVRRRWGLGQVLVTRRGRGKFWSDGVWYEGGPGTAYLAAPNSPQAYHALDDETPWEFAWVMFELDAELSWPPAPTLIEADPEPLWNAVHGLQRESSLGREAAHMTAWAELIALTVRRILRGQGAPDRLRDVWEAVERDLSHPWTLTGLADLACLSTGQLRVVCHQNTGRSPMEQVAYLRMRHAGALFMASDLTVEQAARAVGYANAFAFSTAFKRVMGVPPSRYRH
jgi:AraC-like DNA-binding protein